MDEEARQDDQLQHQYDDLDYDETEYEPIQGTGSEDYDLKDDPNDDLEDYENG